ncbi:MAG: metal-dependent hydrolase [Vicinamibacterales bacterium]
MDNVCHTLVGAACAHAGFAKPARFAAATSMIAANLPDVDVLVYATDVPAVAFRRGWTHGVLAQALLPVALAGVMVLAARSFSRRRTDRERAKFAPLLILAYIGVLSHVVLDYLNNYGVRLLMPFDNRWFYGDTLFIIDPWLWVLFGTAVAAGRHGRVRHSRVWLCLASIYIVCMAGSAFAARHHVVDSWREQRGREPRAFMVGPVPVNPLRKAIIIDDGDRYYSGTFTWLPLGITFSDTPVLKHADDPAVAAARQDARVAGLLVWARFPFWEINPVPDGKEVVVRDMRFTAIRRGGFSARTVVMTRSESVTRPSLLPRHVRADCHPTKIGIARARGKYKKARDARQLRDRAASGCRNPDTDSTGPTSPKRRTRSSDSSTPPP